MYTGWPGQFMKTAMINTLKKINRTVLEMDLGILFLGVSAQIIGAFIAKDEAMYAKSLWFGVLLALVSTYHMYRSLDRALDQPEKTATKMIIRAYVLRYVMLIFSSCPGENQKNSRSTSRPATNRVYRLPFHCLKNVAFIVFSFLAAIFRVRLPVGERATRTPFPLPIRQQRFQQRV